MNAICRICGPFLSLRPLIDIIISTLSTARFYVDIWTNEGAIFIKKGKIRREGGEEV